jgi:hypothetical protein
MLSQIFVLIIKQIRIIKLKQPHKGANKKTLDINFEVHNTNEIYKKKNDGHRNSKACQDENNHVT